MLSPQAACMGTVHTTLRRIGSSKYLTSTVTRKNQPIVAFGVERVPLVSGADPKIHSQTCLRTFSTFTSRSNSSLAAQKHDEDDHEEYFVAEIVDRSLGFKLAGHAAKSYVADDATVINRSHKEAWMINLGRECDEWLNGPREDVWFTGVHPRECPGKFPENCRVLFCGAD